MRKKAYTVYLDEMFLPCVIQVEIIGMVERYTSFGWTDKGELKAPYYELIGMPIPEIDIFLPPLPPDDLCETLEEGFVLSIKKYQNWN